MENRSEHVRTNVENSHAQSGPNLALINGRHVAAKFRRAHGSSRRFTGTGLAFTKSEPRSRQTSVYSQTNHDSTSSDFKSLGGLEATTPAQLKCWDLTHTRKLLHGGGRRRTRSSVKINESLV